MFWYTLEYEIFIYGKDSILVQATDIETAKIIALRKISKSLDCKEENILITSCKQTELPSRDF